MSSPGFDFSGVHSTLVFCPDWLGAAHWWRLMSGARSLRRIPLTAELMLGDALVVFRPPDHRNALGGSPVIYFEVTNMNTARSHLIRWGCIEIHWPLAIPGGEQITQFRDPFGIIVGIAGPAPTSRAVWPELHDDVLSWVRSRGGSSGSRS